MAEALQEEIALTPASSKAKPQVGTVVLSLLLIALSLTITNAHLMAPGQPKTMLVFDSGHYLVSIQKLAEIFSGFLRLQPDLQLLTSEDFTAFIKLDGPVLTIPIAFVFAMLGKNPQGTDWALIAATQSVFQALSTLFVFLISFRLTKSRWCAFVAGVLWALYPSASIAAGRLLNESLTALLELCLVFFAAAAGHKMRSAILSGLSCGLLFLQKPALAPAAALALTVSAFPLRAQWRRTAVALLSLAMVIGAWAAYTWWATGKPALTTSRVPAFNLAMGFDVENGAVITRPTSELVDLCCDNKAPLAMPLAMISSRPQETLSLLLSKLPRLFCMPWNDFAQRFFGAGAALQTLIHRFYLVAAFAGAILFLLNLRYAGEGARRLGIACLGMAFGHVIFVLFEPVPRYGFTATPFYVCFIAYLLQQVQAIVAAETPSKALRWAPIAAACMSALTVTLPLFALGQSLYPPSHRLELKAGQSVCQKIKLPQGLLARSKEQALLVVDCDRRLAEQEVQVAINGESISAYLQPIQCFDHQLYGAQYLNHAADGFGVDADDLRQWRAVPVPVEHLQSGENDVRLSAPAGGAVYGDRKEALYSIPSLVRYSITRLWLGGDLDARLPDFRKAKTTESRILEPSGASSPPLRLDLRVRLAVFPNVKRPIEGKKKKDFSDPLNEGIGSGTSFIHGAAAEAKTFEYFFTADKWDPVMRLPDGGIRTSRAVLRCSSTNTSTVKLPAANATHQLMAISFESKAAPRPGKAGIALALTGANGKTFVLQRNPSFIPTAPEWQATTIRELVPLGAMGGQISSVGMVVYPGPWFQVGTYGTDKSCTETIFRNIKLAARPLSLPDFNLDAARVY